jgi:hypothetical protein
MKKTLLILTITTISLANTFARDISEKRALFSFMGGVGFATMSQEKQVEEAKNGVKIGGMAGFGFEHRFKKVAAIELNLLYVNKGVQQKFDNDISKGYFRFNFHSVEVPLLVKFYVGKKKIFNLYAGGYGAYAFNVQSKTKITNKLNDETEVEKVNNLLSNDNNPKDVNDKRLFRAFDAGVTGGFEFISKSGFGAGARLNKGLLDYTNPKFVIDDGKWITHTNVMFYALIKI